MLVEQVKKLTPFNRLLYWIREREKIRLLKEADKPKPYTDDVILQNYRFCNVRRMDDKVSQWLLHNWYEPFYNHPNMLIAAALARFFNNPDTLQVIGFPQTYNVEQLRKKLKSYRDADNKIFNGAYVLCTDTRGDRIDAVFDAWMPAIRKIKVNPDSMQATHGLLSECYGIGSFLSGQIVADLRHGIKGKWIDRCDWAPMGPGSRRGMNRLKGRNITYSLNQVQFLKELRELIQECEDVLPESIVSNMEAIDFQGTLCEIDKYSRSLEGVGRPKCKYKGI